MSFSIDQARPVRDGEQLDVARLSDYLADRTFARANEPLSRRAVPSRALEPDLLDHGGDDEWVLAPAPVRQPGQDGPRHGPRVSHPLAALPRLSARPGACALL